ncbi:MAG: hypothetical protein GY937_23010 [bacterium]|nr:hypothetical protein [bacterium]
MLELEPWRRCGCGRVRHYLGTFEPPQGGRPVHWYLCESADENDPRRFGHVGALEAVALDEDEYRDWLQVRASVALERAMMGEQHEDADATRAG